MSMKVDLLSERIRALAKESVGYRARCKALMDIVEVVETRLADLVEEFVRLSEEEEGDLVVGRHDD